MEVSPLEGLRTASPPKVLLVGFAEAKAEGSYPSTALAFVTGGFPLLQSASTKGGYGKPLVERSLSAFPLRGEAVGFSPLPPKVDTENLWWREAADSLSTEGGKAAQLC